MINEHFQPQRQTTEANVSLRENSEEEEEEREESSDDFEESRPRAKRNRAGDAPPRKSIQRLFGMPEFFYLLFKVEFVVVFLHFCNPKLSGGPAINIFRAVVCCIEVCMYISKPLLIWWINIAWSSICYLDLCLSFI